jgi:[ribosomal protein S5]-alanine N-acetyltransferase
MLLRPPNLGDADAIFKLYAQDITVLRYLTWSPHASVEITRNVIKGYIDEWERKIRLSWVIVRREDQQVVGMISLRLKRFEAILGYVLGQAYWGQGIMTETVRVVIDWALGQPSIFRVSAVCDAENLASAHVMEKAGMQREGLVHRGIIHPNISPEPRDCWLYAKVR